MNDEDPIEEIDVDCTVQFMNAPNPLWFTCTIPASKMREVLQYGMLESVPLRAIKVIHYVPGEEDTWPETAFVYNFNTKEWSVE
jgi:hypothetical protein